MSSESSYTESSESINSEGTSEYWSSDSDTDSPLDPSESFDDDADSGQYYGLSNSASDNQQLISDTDETWSE